MNIKAGKALGFLTAEEFSSHRFLKRCRFSNVKIPKRELDFYF